MRLRVKSVDGTTFVHTLEGERQVIGRASRAAIMLKDPSMSREHAQFVCRDGSWYVEDLGSQNGTLVNGRAITGAVPLESGDRLTLGGTEVTVVDASQTLADDHDSLFRSAREVLDGTTATGVRAAAADHRELRRLAQRLSILNEVHQSLGGPMTVEEALDMILDRLFVHLQPEEGAVYLREEDGTLRCAASRSKSSREVEPLYSRHLIDQVLGKGMAAVVLDASIDERFSSAASIISRGVRSLVAAPLAAPEGPIGMIVLSSNLLTRQFAEADMELLTSVAAVAAMRVVNTRLVNEALERQQLEQELTLARRIQEAIIPAAVPTLAGWDIHGSNQPSRGVSGDFFKVVERTHGDEGVVLVADVSGKGFAAALLTASLEALMTVPIDTGMAPAQICTVVSKLLYQRTPPERFITAVVCSFNRATGAVSLASAGHNPALLMRADGSSAWLAATGVPLGLMSNARFDQVELVLAGGDLLVFYTDGITEARDPANQEYGEERLEALVAAERGRSARELTEALEGDVEAFAAGLTFEDDRTIVLLKRL